MRPVVLIDTYSLLFRAHYALPPLSTQEGEPTAALYGFCSLLLKVLREQQPVGIGFALDTPARSFRRERYEDYKANRLRAPMLVLHQLRRLDSLLGELELPMFSAAGYEADDVLATLASRLQGQNQSALIVSGDRDLLQLVGAGTAVLFVGGRGKAHVHYDTASRVEQRFGVKAQQLPSLAALVGDASDNLPGVPGIGPKIGATLVNRYGDVPGILRNLDAIEPARVREALAQHREQLLLNEELTRLCTDVPLGNGPSWAPITRRLIERLRVMFETLEFQSLLARLDQIQVVDDAGIQNR